MQVPLGLALQSSSAQGNRSVVFYLVTYTFMVAGSVAVLVLDFIITKLLISVFY